MDMPKIFKLQKLDGRSACEAPKSLRTDKQQETTVKLEDENLKGMTPTSQRSWLRNTIMQGGQPTSQHQAVNDLARDANSTPPR